MGLSLWLVPSPAQSSSLSRLMHIRPPTSSSPASYPQFHPHITLTTVTSATPLQTLLASIPKSQPSVRANFDALKTGDQYFRSVYIAVTSSPELSLLHKQIHNHLGIEDPKTPAFPHMSVYYIDDSEPEERERVAQELLTNGAIAPDVDGGGIIVDYSKTPQGSLSLTQPRSNTLNGFDGMEIWAALCDGPVETWVVLEKVRLL